MTRIIVTGDRGWEPIDTICHIFGQEFVRHGFDVIIVHGDCRGVDRAAATAAGWYGFTAEPHPAEDFGPWPACGPKRNVHMVSLGADQCIAFHRDLVASKGTRDCVRRALAAGIPVWLVDGREGETEATDGGVTDGR